MPYKSLAQVGWMHANEPEVAAKWDKKYGVKKGLPKKARPKKKRGCK